MSANSRPNKVHRLLSAATASAIPTLPKPASLCPNVPKSASAPRIFSQNEATTLPKPAPLCPNVPKPAPALEILQNEATDFSFSQLPRSIRATYPKTDAEVRQYVKSLQAKSTHPANPPKSRAQMCSNVPECASLTPLRQNEAKSHSDTPAPQPPTLPPRQLQAARLLIAGHTTKSAGAHLKVNPHTVSRWKKHPAFQQEITRLLAPFR